MSHLTSPPNCCPGSFHFGITPEKLTQIHESKPWNPIVAEVLHRTGLIEKWGSGTVNILGWCKENGNPPVTWFDDAETVYTRFLPRTEQVTLQVTLQVTPQVKRLIECLQDGDKSRSELMSDFGLKDRMHFSREILQPAIEVGFIEMTISERPNSRLQKYRITDKGRKVLTEIEPNPETGNEN